MWLFAADSGLHNIRCNVIQLLGKKHTKKCEMHLCAQVDAHVANSCLVYACSRAQQELTLQIMSFLSSFIDYGLLASRPCIICTYIYTDFI